MANFELVPIAGVTPRAWADPPSATKPSRLTSVDGVSHNYHSMQVGTLVRIAAKVGSVIGPPDADLDLQLFSWWFAEHPMGGAPPFASAPGLSSILNFTPVGPGGYLLVAARLDGGRVAIHLRCE